MIFQPPSRRKGKEGPMVFHGIHPVLEGILRSVALDPWEHYPTGSERLLPPPGDDEDLVNDWNDHVQSGLREGFTTARSVVVEDLAGMTMDTEGSWRLEIPPGHAEAWLLTLNALRLSLAHEHGLDEGDLSDDRDDEVDMGSEKGFAQMQVNLFAFMQECLVRHAPGL